MNPLFPILIALGAVGLILGAILLGRLRSALHHSTCVEGTVTSLSQARGSEESVNHHIVVDYLGLLGQPCTVTSNVASSPPMARVGDKVRIAIDRRNGRVRIVLFFELYFGLVMLFLFSLLALLIGCWQMGCLRFLTR